MKLLLIGYVFYKMGIVYTFQHQDLLMPVSLLLIYKEGYQLKTINALFLYANPRFYLRVLV